MPRPRNTLLDAEAESSLLYPADARWSHRARTRLTAHWLLKFTSSIGFVGVFFVGYFLLLKYPVFEAKAMPVLGLDRWVPFQPAALWIYVSLWLYVNLAPALLLHRADVAAYGKALIAMAGVGFAIFFFFPTKLAASSIDWREHAAFQALKEVDASGNACPSLHVAFAVFTAFSLARTIREIRGPRLLQFCNASWCLAITYSTLATRQHVMLDVLGGALLATGVWLIYSATSSTRV